MRSCKVVRLTKTQVVRAFYQCDYIALAVFQRGNATRLAEINVPGEFAHDHEIQVALLDRRDAVPFGEDIVFYLKVIYSDVDFQSGRPIFA